MGPGEVVKPYTIDVVLCEKVYNPGDTVQGEVNFHLNRKLFCDTVSAQLCGTAKVFWTTNEPHNGSFHSVPHGQKKMLVDEKTVIWSAEKKKRLPAEPSLEDIVRYSSSTAIRMKKVERSEDDCGLEPGSHRMPFCFQLPKEGLFTSFEQRDCPACVRYSIIVQCFSNEQLVAKSKLLFPVVCPVDLRNSPIATESEDVNRKINFGKNGYLNVQLNLSKKGFVPGERVPVRIFIDNQSGKSVKYAHLSLIQHAFCAATYPDPCGKDSYMETSGVGLPIPKVVNGSVYKYEPAFYVPALVPDFEIIGCIRVDHTLKFEVAFTRKPRCKYSVCVIKIPIFIGTSHVDSAGGALVSLSKHAESNANNPLEGEEIGASAYPMSSLSLPPPPTYMESVTGRSDVQEGDEECPAYTPLYYGCLCPLMPDADDKKTQ